MRTCTNFVSVSVSRTLKNVVALFHVLEKEMAWRQSNGKAEGFEAMKAHKPIVAMGAEHPLEDEELMADNFRKYRHVAGCYYQCSS